MAAAAATLLREAGMETETEFFHTASELLKAHKQGTSWDLILLDIMMDDGQDGINVAECLRERGDETDLVFVSRSPEFALAGYRSYPVRYLLKPLTQENLRPVLLHCLERRKERPSLILETLGGGATAIRLSDIRYIEIFRRELVVHCKEKTVSCFGALKTVLDALPPESFYHCHRSFIVNLACVSGIQKYRFLLHGEGEVPVAVRRYQDAQARWLEFLT